jgi:gluconolactonase
LRTRTGFRARPGQIFRIIFLPCLAWGVAVTSLFAGESPVVAAGAQLQQLAGEYQFTEGPTADADGNVYFTDQPNDRIVRWRAADGSVEDWVQPAGRANGLFLTTGGALLAAADEHNQLWSIAPDKQVTVLVEKQDGKLLNGPNDIWVSRSGDIYFTDPLYARGYWSRDPVMQQSGQHVYLLAAGADEAQPVLTDLQQPNGIIGSLDGRTLYVSDIGAGRTYAYDIRDDGAPVNKRLFCELGSDGMTTDNEGNVYLTGQGVAVFDRNGNRIEHIEVPQDWTANVTFGGAGHDMLFITASKAIYGIRMRVRGVLAH